jgi:precorrin-6x reductase
MYKVVVFGGTTEGRMIHEYMMEQNIDALTCVATEYGAGMLQGSHIQGAERQGLEPQSMELQDIEDQSPKTIVGRLDRVEMEELLRIHHPMLVVDATHPYAAEASANIEASCLKTGTEYIRVRRQAGVDSLGCSFEEYPTLDGIMDKLGATHGQVFIALGAKEAHAFTALPGYKDRLWLRLLPSVDGLRECISLGFPAQRLICMQGPFSKELNASMFRHTGAKTLVTKDSGDAGGFADKLSAAKELGMDVLVLGRPAQTRGVSLDGVFKRLAGL